MTALKVFAEYNGGLETRDTIFFCFQIFASEHSASIGETEDMSVCFSYHDLNVYTRLHFPDHDGKAFAASCAGHVLGVSVKWYYD
jgi:hypothetical protein